MKITSHCVQLCCLLGLAVCAVRFSESPAGGSIVSEWQFDEGSGTIINDSSGNGNSGTLIGSKAGTRSVGKHGGGLYFDGTVGANATLVDFGNKPSFQITGAISFTAWIKSDDANRDAPILAKEGPAKLSYWFGLYPYNAFGMLLDQDGNQGWEGYDRDNPIGVAPGTWVHLACTWDTATIRHYVNGSKVAEAPYSGPIHVSDALLVLGVNSDYQNLSNGTAFKGWLDNVRLYNNALSPQELQNSMEFVSISSIWTVNTDGKWFTPSNWIGGVPSGQGDTASFTGATLAAVNVDSPVTVGRLFFDAGTAGTNYALSGSAITLDNTGGTGSGALIDVVSGNHTINCPVILATDATVTGSGTVNFTGGVTGNQTLTVLGNVTVLSIQVSTLTIGGTGTATAVPGPSIVVLFGMGVAGLMGAAWRKRSSAR
jgi:hypothetical protein